MKIKRRSQAVWIGAVAYFLLTSLGVRLDCAAVLALAVGTYVYDSTGF